MLVDHQIKKLRHYKLPDFHVFEGVWVSSSSDDTGLHLFVVMNSNYNLVLAIQYNPECENLKDEHNLRPNNLHEQFGILMKCRGKFRVPYL